MFICWSVELRLNNNKTLAFSNKLGYQLVQQSVTYLFNLPIKLTKAEFNIIGNLLKRLKERVTCKQLVPDTHDENSLNKSNGTVGEVIVRAEGMGHNQKSSW